jgi:hypothetical protein
MDGLANRYTTNSGHKITMKYGGASANYRPKKVFRDWQLSGEKLSPATYLAFSSREQCSYTS